MQVGQQDVDRALDPGQRQPQITNAGPGVEDQRAAIRKRQLDAGGVAAVVHRFGPWSRY